MIKVNRLYVSKEGYLLRSFELPPRRKRYLPEGEGFSHLSFPSPLNDDKEVEE